MARDDLQTRPEGDPRRASAPPPPPPNRWLDDDDLGIAVLTYDRDHPNGPAVRLICDPAAGYVQLSVNTARTVAGALVRAATYLDASGAGCAIGVDVLEAAGSPTEAFVVLSMFQMSGGVAAEQPLDIADARRVVAMFERAIHMAEGIEAERGATGG